MIIGKPRLINKDSSGNPFEKGNGNPYGIRDDDGFLFFFTGIDSYSGQESRYKKEVQKQRMLANFLLARLVSLFELQQAALKIK